MIPVVNVNPPQINNILAEVGKIEINGFNWDNAIQPINKHIHTVYSFINLNHIISKITANIAIHQTNANNCIPNPFRSVTNKKGVYVPAMKIKIPA